MKRVRIKYDGIGGTFFIKKGAMLIYWNIRKITYGIRKLRHYYIVVRGMNDWGTDSPIDGRYRKYDHWMKAYSAILKEVAK